MLPLEHKLHVEIAQPLAEQRALKGKSQTDIPNELDVSWQSIQKYETGRVRVTAARLVLIAHILDLPIDTFLPPHLKTVQTDPTLAQLIASYNNIKSPTTRMFLAEMAKDLAEMAKDREA